MDEPGIPIAVALVIFLAIPSVVVFVLGFNTFRDMTPLVFRCARCGREFRRRPWKGFPARCPACKASDWNRT